MVPGGNRAGHQPRHGAEASPDVGNDAGGFRFAGDRQKRQPCVLRSTSLWMFLMP